MEYKKPNREIRPMPEVRLPGLLGKAVHRLVHVRPIYWLTGTVAVLAVFVIFVPESVWTALWAGIRAQKFLMVMLAAFSLLALSLVWTTGQRIDVWFFMNINKRGRHPRWLDGVMLGFTQIGNGVFAYTTAFVLFFNDQHLIAYELMFGTLTLWLAVEMMKVLIGRNRPYSGLAGTRVVGHREGGHSFPSGHTSQAFFMASLFSHYYGFGFCTALLAYAAALLVGVTRIYVGMHYPRDVMGGAILGTAWGLAGGIINSFIFSHLLSRFIL